MVTVDGLLEGDEFTSIALDGQGTDAGAYDLTPSGASVNGVSADVKYDVTYALGKLTSSKAKSQVDTVPTAKNLAWNGEKQALAEAGSAEGGEMQYALGADGKTAPKDGWTTDVPAAADPGTYYVWYKAVGDKNHSDSEAACVTSTITAKLVSVTVTFKVKNGTWDDTTAAQKTVALSRYENEDKALVLAAKDIPADGNQPAEHYRAGSWDATPSTTYALTADTVYTYTYAEAGMLTIRFDANGGTGSIPSFTYDAEKKATLPDNAFVKSGFYLTGWNTAADGSGTTFANRGTVQNLECTLYAQWKNIYNVIEGANAKVQKGGYGGVTFRADGDYAKLTGIRVDNRNVPSSMYDAKSGSTIVTLKAAFVDQLAAGKHTIAFLYTDGSCETTFEVHPKKTPTPASTRGRAAVATPKTGDAQSAGRWMLPLAGSLVSLTLALVLKRWARVHQS